MDAIPIQDLVDNAKSRSIDLLSKYVIGQIAALTGPLSGFFGKLLEAIIGKLVRWVVTKVVEFSDRKLFNFNADILTTDQASDYRKAEAAVIRAKDDPSVSDEEFERLEYEANHKFDQLVNLAK